MNCQDVSLILDDRDLTALTAAEHEAVRSHLAACRDCSADWRAFSRVAACKPPPPPPTLAAGVARTLRSRAGLHEAARRSARPLFLAGLLLGGAALAVLATSYGPGDRGDGDGSFESTADPATRAAPVTALPKDVVSDVARTTEPAAVAPARARVLVLPPRVESSDPRAAIFAEQVHESMVRGLRAAKSLEIVSLDTAELAAVVPSIAGPLRDGDAIAFRAATQRFGGSTVVEIALHDAQPDIWNIGVTMRYSLTTRLSPGSFSRNGGSGIATDRLGFDDPRPDKDADTLGRRFAASVIDDVPLSAPRAAPADASIVETVLDPTLPDDARVRALSSLHGSDFTAAAIAAAVDLGTQAESAEWRVLVWQILRANVYEPTLARPAAYALQTDPSPAVRREAARLLRDYRNVAEAESALEHAGAHDLSTEVRLAARMMILGDDAQPDFVRETLLDSTLAPAERLAPLSWAGPMTRIVMDRDAAYVAAAEIAGASDDPVVQRSALDAIRTGGLAMPPPEVLDVLIAHADDTTPSVRRAALYALTAFVADGRVRTRLETALAREELDPALERSIEEALERPEGVR